MGHVAAVINDELLLWGGVATREDTGELRLCYSDVIECFNRLTNQWNQLQVISESPFDIPHPCVPRYELVSSKNATFINLEAASRLLIAVGFMQAVFTSWTVRRSTGNKFFPRKKPRPSENHNMDCAFWGKKETSIWRPLQYQADINSFPLKLSRIWEVTITFGFSPYKRVSWL